MKFDFKELEAERKRNRDERLKFIEMYVEWLKKTPNKVWSKHQAAFIDSVISSSNEIRKFLKDKKVI